MLRSTTPIGLDIGSRTVKAVQLRRARGRWTLHATAVVPRVAGHTADQTAARVAAVLERQGFIRRRVVIAAPVRKVESEMLELPPRGSGAPVEQLARTELARVAELQQGAFETTCWDVPATSRHKGTTVIALALRHADAEAMVVPLEQQGLEVVAIDAQGWARLRAFRSLCPQDSAIAVLDLGWSAASLHVLDRTTVLYQRTLWDAGVEYLYSALVAERGLSDETAELMLRAEGEGRRDVPRPKWLPGLVRPYAEQLCDELLASLSFARQRFPGRCGDQLLATGGGTALPGVMAMLAERLGVQVKVASMQDIVDAGAGLTEEARSPLLATAVGLALYEEEP